MKKVLFFVIAVILTAIITATVTYKYMIYSAQPSTACTIEWNGCIYEYE